MVHPEPLTCTVIRVTRPDTILVRTFAPQVQATISIHLLLEGVKCLPEAKQSICDWCEVHNDFDRLKLMTFDWVRDGYGRVLGNLADLQSGEVLTDYLLEQKVAWPYPNHYMDMLASLIADSVEPEEC